MPRACVSGWRHIGLATSLCFTLAVVACSDAVTGVTLPQDPVRNATTNATSTSCLLVSASDSSLFVGDSVFLSATVLTTRRNGKTGTSSTGVTWSSSNPSVVAVVGRYARGLSAGAAVLLATAASCSNSVPVTVADKPPVVVPTPAPTPAKQLPLTLQWLDRSVATPVASNGIPLPAGYLFERDLPTVALSDGTQEIARVLTPLAGRYADGSLRAVLLQFRADPTKTALQLLIGSTHTLADPAPWPIPSPMPQAVAYPSSPAFLVSTQLVGPTITVAENPGATYEAQFQTFSDKHWLAEGAQWDQANYYDRALSHFTYWMRSGDLKYWQRAVQLALNYRTQYIEASGFGPSPHWMLLEGLAAHYWLTGDTLSRTAVIKSIARVWQGFTPTNMADPTYAYIEGRIQARMMVGSLLAWELGDTGQDWKALATAYKNNMITLQRADGSYAWPNWCGHQANFMVGMQNDAMIKYHERVQADPAIITTIRKSVDYMSSIAWRPLQQGFSYMDIPCLPTDDMSPMFDLNMLIVTGYAFTGAKTGQRSYIATADSIASGAMTSSWLDGSKQFNQQYYDSHQWLWYRK